METTDWRVEHEAIQHDKTALIHILMEGDVKGLQESWKVLHVICIFGGCCDNE